jgi:hypothetical protein
VADWGESLLGNVESTVIEYRIPNIYPPLVEEIWNLEVLKLLHSLIAIPCS